MIKNEKINLDLRYSDSSLNYGRIVIESIQSKFLFLKLLQNIQKLRRLLEL